jgi:signal transduction histidine kinase/CheY-like chemotaxis protein
LFWTTLPQTLTFPLIYFLCAMLFWISLRFGARSISMGIFLLAGIGIAGSIIMHPSPTVPVNFQLFADELFIILIAPIFLIFVAVTEERRATSEDLASNVVQLQEAMMRLNLEDKFKNEFIAILAHELRNPLASVMSALEVLAIESGLSGESTRMIDNAQQQTVAMRRLLDDLLDVARVTQQKFKLQKERVDLGSVLTRSIENTRQFIADKGHTFSLSLPPELIYLYADPIRLGQIIVNLLNNAAKYTLPGGRIELVSSINDTNIMIEVRDNGIGIPQAELQNIFQPFNQLPGTVRLESGLGIGLSLTRRLVEMHEGTIEAVSQGVGKGSTFVIKLPLIEVPVATVSPIQLPVPVKKGLFTQRPVKTPYNILVVDDNESAAQGLGKLLQHNGHQVTLAHTGEHALEISRTITPEIMLLDIGLPDISGYEVAKELRSRNEFPLTLIALTGYGQDEDKKRAVAAGFNFHLTKPVSIKDVETLLQSV